MGEVTVAVTTPPPSSPSVPSTPSPTSAAKVAATTTLQDSFAGWSDSDHDRDQSIENQRKKWLGGTVGAGVAGVILFAGLTFAALSLSKWSTSRPKQQIEPFTTQQEVSLASDKEDDKVEESKSEASNDSDLESKTGTQTDLSSSPEPNEAPSENKLGDSTETSTADNVAGDQGIISLAFGCTRLFQPDKPVTKAQAAVALATGEASDTVSEELARIEAESVAENAVSAHNALVAQVEQDINASFEKELSMEREKINAVETMAEEVRCELERLRAEREKDDVALMKERIAIESEMEVLSKLRREVEEQLQSLLSNKVEISYEKERISKLQKEAESEKQEISRLQYDLEVERKALSMAR
ncbi:hypothetical protein OIU84_007590 [Salix udensis]|uniref:Uncharacterized protein n=1 Tax=Salix udensis TaxID=889485 RepID=A0AAD6NZK5_9ROSI|nr:hypothetical protein OIU84_007590 [Salix udensis]